uniref:JmjC domain-containing protein n=1 Tax=Ascaris lumbricoides TaxID=6252 RepID=A0A0M3IIR2_ASCLU
NDAKYCFEVVDDDRGTVYARSSFLDDVCAGTESEVAPGVIMNDVCGTQSSANSQRRSCSNGSVGSRPRLLPSDDEESGDEADSPRLATNRPNVLAEDSSDEGESSRSRRRIIDDDVKSVVADSIVYGEDNDDESNGDNLFRIDSRTLQSNNRRLSGVLNDEDGLHDVRGNASLEDSIVAGPANQSRIADLQTQFILNPISHSTQRDANGTNITQQYGFMKVARDFDNQPNASVTTSKGRKEVKIVSTGAEGRLPKRRGRPPKGRELSSRSDVESDNVQQLTSRKNMIDRINTSIVGNEMQNEVEGIRSKRIKLEAENGLDRDIEDMKMEEEQQDDNLIIGLDIETLRRKLENGLDRDIGDMKMEEEQQDDNLIIGLDIETLRRKLAKVVEYSDLERRRPHQTQTSHNSSTNSDGVRSMTTSALIMPNVKRFKKAPQGCYSQEFLSRYQPITQIIGRTDMVDFRELKATIV